MQTLSLEDAEEMQECIIGSTVLGSRWETDFNRFMQKGKTGNATFALHFDIFDFRKCNKGNSGKQCWYFLFPSRSFSKSYTNFIIWTK
jgi:hypothetical protein